MKKFKYKIVKNFLSKDEVELLKIWMGLTHRNNQKFFCPYVDTADTIFYGISITDSLLLKYNNKINKIVNKNLLPTYSASRVYTKFATLKKHKDRESCELSVTINVGSDGTDWPIYLQNKPILLKEGDGLIYSGKDIEHWREEFLGDWYGQIFLHYVYENGKFKDFYKDKRPNFGMVIEKGGEVLNEI